MNPQSPGPCTVGARTPRSPKLRQVCSPVMRKAATESGSGASCSVATRPGSRHQRARHAGERLVGPDQRSAERLGRSAVTENEVFRIGVVAPL